MQSSNWNTYRGKVADAAPAVAEAAPATKGKITARVDDKAPATGAKEVVVLSKGDGAAAKGGKDGKDRVRALEDDLAARDKALAEAKDRVAALEKTIKDMQKLAEIKNPALAAAQQAGKAEPKPEPKADAKGAPPKDAPKAEPAKAEPPKAAEPAKAEPAKAPEPKAETPATEPPKAEAPKPAPVPPKAATPAPKAPAKAAPPEPGIMDTVMDNIVPIGGGGAVLAGLAGWWAVRRRKKANEVVDDETPVFVPKTEPTADNARVASAVAAAIADAPEPTVASVTPDMVDPIEEAQVYIDHGRDNQAEDILKEAMEKDPQRQDVQLKLLEVYAARGDKGAFNKLAKDFNALTGGTGENWDKAAAMGHAIDPSNALYPSSGEIFDIGAGDGGVSDATVDLDISGEDSLGTTTDILLEDQSATDSSLDKTMMMTRSDLPAVAESAPAAAAAEPEALPEFNLDLPPVNAEPEAPVVAAAPAAEATNLMDFNLDLPSLDTPAAPAAAAPAAAPAADGGLDFKVDLDGINLNLDEKPAASAGGGDKDAHWNDVQQKFDLARAYQDMGDKDGAKEILNEVMREGDATQKAEAQKLLDSIK